MISKYFENLQKEVKKAYELASKAKLNSYDPDRNVPIPIAKNIFERVEGLISSIKPEIRGSGVAKRLEELEKEYGSGDWRVGLKIAEEVAQQKFFKCENEEEAIEFGIRIGLAYLTMGVVAAPLEGFISFKIKDRNDGGKYGAVYFAGPIRAAGGTAAAVTLLLADYVRRKFNLQPFDITKEEIERTIAECDDYHEKIARLQYHPTKEEMEFLLKNLPIEINGDPTSDREVLIHKDLPRVGTSRIRGGMCLVLCEGLAQKAQKILKKIKKWGKNFGLEDWMFLEEYVKLKEKLHAKSKGETIESDIKIKPNVVYIEEIVAGRPVFSYPLAKGGFRLRYGRTRLSGLAAASFHPATMQILNKFIATGAQLRLERPGKACAATPCDIVMGPIVKLNDESVIEIKTEKQAIELKDKIKEILFLGDILIPYGEFLRNNHILVPSPYVEEWWEQELKKVAGNIEIEESPEKLIEYSLKYNVPLHPKLLFFYKYTSPENIIYLMRVLTNSKIEPDKILIPHDKTVKKILEEICMPHKLTTNGILIEKESAIGLLWAIGYYPEKEIKISKAESLLKEGKNTLQILNELSKFEIRDKAGYTIGARLGRPEKAKSRKLKGSPNGLFPVGMQGGRMRSLNEAYQKGFVEAEFPTFFCEKCNAKTIYSICPTCKSETKILRNCVRCGKETTAETHCGLKTVPYKRQKLNIKYYVDSALEKLGINLPPLVKGVRGTWNSFRLPEPIEKVILRAYHSVYVNKDGTIRFDAIETPITHFKPLEIGTPISKLKELGYTHDIYGKPLEREDQILELFPQDVILPDCRNWQDASALEMIYKTCQFVDDLLVRYYGMEPYYKIKTPQDIIGHLIISLAPHTSAGMVGRIIGFSKTQGFYAHPYFHSANRRNCVHPSTPVVIYDNKTNEVFVEGIGKITEELMKKSKVRKDGEYKFIDAPENWEVFSIDPETHRTIRRKIRIFLKGPAEKEWIKIKTATGREFTMTEDHIFLYLDEKGELKSKEAKNVKVGDPIPLAFNFNPPISNKKKIDLIKEFLKLKNGKIKNEIRVTNASKFFKKLANKYSASFIKKILNLKTLSHWYKSVPLSHVEKLIYYNLISLKNIPKNARLKLRLNEINRFMKISKYLMRILGYYLSEGHLRENYSTHQISFRISDKKMMQDLSKCVKRTFNVNLYLQDNNTKLTISNKLVYYIFKYVFNVGSDAYSKKVPSFIYNLNKELISEFLGAFFDGDGTVVYNPLRLRFYSVSKKLLENISLLLLRFDVLARFAEVKPRLPGRAVLERYRYLGKQPKKTKLYHLVLGKKDIIKFAKICKSKNDRKRKIIEKIRKLKEPDYSYTSFNGKMIALKAFSDYTIDYVEKVEILHENANVYCLDIYTEKDKYVEKNLLWGNQLYQIRCDGDELGFMMLMDALLNFSQKYLPDKRGGRSMDAPLVLTTKLDPAEVDDEVYNMDIVDHYPLEFYEATLKWAAPHEVKIKIVENVIGKQEQYKGFKYTHEVSNMNIGPLVSAYKTLTTVADKVVKQMELAEKIRAVDKSDVARIVVEKHFLKDIKGNLRKFTRQEFRCISCNTKFRRIPLSGKCTNCGGKLVLTVAEGTVNKYLEPSLELAKKYALPEYLKQTLEILKRRIDSIFGKEKTKQKGLNEFFT